MRRKNLRFKKGFRIVIDAQKSQAAEMVLAPGGKEGDPTNRHRASDQWLFVVSGVGTATINGRTMPLRKGSLFFIQRGDRHEIKNSGRAPLKTLNFYVPPAYTKDGDELPRGER